MISIIICTRNRAEHLLPTLNSIAETRVPSTMLVELLIIDNASTDNTAELARNFVLPNMELRYILETNAGKSYAQNTGLTNARGQVILFTDDDVRVPPDWIEEMCQPISSGVVDAIVGGVRIAPHLLRPWMEEVHRVALASTEQSNTEYPGNLVGANMSMSARVLDQVPCFDVELGPGGLGFGEESLFSMQIERAGYRITAGTVAVEHHFDESRLSRSQFEKNMQASGRSRAYLDHHWLHKTVALPRLRLIFYSLKLSAWRLTHRRETQRVEGMDKHEMGLVFRIGWMRQYLKENHRPRNYEPQGLTKVSLL